MHVYSTTTEQWAIVTPDGDEHTAAAAVTDNHDRPAAYAVAVTTDGTPYAYGHRASAIPSLALARPGAPTPTAAPTGLPVRDARGARLDWTSTTPDAAAAFERAHGIWPY